MIFFHRIDHSTALHAFPASKLVSIGASIVKWYRQHQTALPFRSTYKFGHNFEGNNASPSIDANNVLLGFSLRDWIYRVYISETMSQQTQITRVVEHFDRWMKTFPTLDSVFDAIESDPDAFRTSILSLWQGLGYYRRATNIIKTLTILCENQRSDFPQNSAELCALPGIGSYIAGAILCIGYGNDTPPLDVNLFRVLCRVAGVHPAIRITIESELLNSQRIVFPPKLGEIDKNAPEEGAETVAQTTSSESKNIVNFADISTDMIKTANKGSFSLATSFVVHFSQALFYALRIASTNGTQDISDKNPDIDAASDNDSIQQILTDDAYSAHFITSELAQGLMDISRLLCSKESPNCSICPLQDDCQAHLQTSRTQNARVPFEQRNDFLIDIEDIDQSLSSISFGQTAQRTIASTSGQKSKTTSVSNIKRRQTSLSLTNAAVVPISIDDDAFVKVTDDYLSLSNQKQNQMRKSSSKQQFLDQFADTYNLYLSNDDDSDHQPCFLCGEHLVIDQIQAHDNGSMISTASTSDNSDPKCWFPCDPSGYSVELKPRQYCQYPALECCEIIIPLSADETPAVVKTSSTKKQRLTQQTVSPANTLAAFLGKRGPTGLIQEQSTSSNHMDDDIEQIDTNCKISQTKTAAKTTKSPKKNSSKTSLFSSSSPSSSSLASSLQKQSLSYSKSSRSTHLSLPTLFAVRPRICDEDQSSDSVVWEVLLSKIQYNSSSPSVSTSGPLEHQFTLPFCVHNTSKETPSVFSDYGQAYMISKQEEKLYQDQIHPSILHYHSISSQNTSLPPSSCILTESATVIRDNAMKTALEHDFKCLTSLSSSPSSTQSSSSQGKPSRRPSNSNLLSAFQPKIPVKRHHSEIVEIHSSSEDDKDDSNDALTINHPTSPNQKLDPEHIAALLTQLKLISKSLFQPSDYLAQIISLHPFSVDRNAIFFFFYQRLFLPFIYRLSCINHQSHIAVLPSPSDPSSSLPLPDLNSPNSVLARPKCCQDIDAFDTSEPIICPNLTLFTPTNQALGNAKLGSQVILQCPHAIFLYDKTTQTRIRLDQDQLIVSSYSNSVHSTSESCPPVNSHAFQQTYAHIDFQQNINFSTLHSTAMGPSSPIDSSSSFSTLSNNNIASTNLLSFYSSHSSCNPDHSSEGEDTSSSLYSAIASFAQNSIICSPIVHDFSHIGNTFHPICTSFQPPDNFMWKSRLAASQYLCFFNPSNSPSQVKSSSFCTWIETITNPEIYTQCWMPLEFQNAQRTNHQQTCKSNDTGTSLSSSQSSAPESPPIISIPFSCVNSTSSDRSSWDKASFSQIFQSPNDECDEKLQTSSYNCYFLPNNLQFQDLSQYLVISSSSKKMITTLTTILSWYISRFHAKQK